MIRKRSSQQLSRVSARLRDESGVAMIVAMATLLIVGVLAAGTVTLALNTNSQSRQDIAQKKATQAAEAGLQAGLYEYNQLQPGSAGPTDCIGYTTTGTTTAPTTTTATPNSSSGTCTGPTTTLPNGSSYTYYTTPPDPSESCVGGTVSDTTAAVDTACVTAVGRDAGATIREQIQASAFQAKPLFPYDGITVLSPGTESQPSLSLGKGQGASSPSITGNVASNGYVSLTNGSKLSGSLYLVNPSTNNGTPFSAQTLPQAMVGGEASGFGAAEANNNDSIINTAPYSQNATYNPSTGNLDVTGQLTLPGDVYYFCSITLEKGGTLGVSSTGGAEVQIYVDSFTDPNSRTSTGGTCPAPPTTTVNGVTEYVPILDNSPGNSEKLSISGGPDPLSMQIYIYGTEPTPSYFGFKNDGSFDGILYAPYTNVDFQENTNFTGAITAATLTADNNFSFTWGGSELQKLQATPEGLYYRTSWGTCTSSPPTGGTEMSGCS